MTKQLNTLTAELEKSFGAGSVRMGGIARQLNSVPTGSLALDYELGTGGWPLGYLVGVYGRRDVGKSSIIAFNAIKNAQAMGLNCAWIAMEPHFDDAWAQKNGVDTENLLLSWPLTGEEAFAMTHKIVRSGAVDFVIFDSLGALLGESEMDQDGKPRQGGQAGLITWGVKAIAPYAHRNNVCVMFINQVRQRMDSRIPGLLKQPGGEALEHMESIIVRLRPGSGKYTIKQNGQDVVVGQEIVCGIERNKCSEGGGRKAVFDFFSMETDIYPFGIDEVSDIVNTAKRTGVIKARGSWMDLPNGETFNGLKQVDVYLRENPMVVALIRDQVLAVMLQKQEPEVVDEVEVLA